MRGLGRRTALEILQTGDARPNCPKRKEAPSKGMLPAAQAWNHCYLLLLIQWLGRTNTQENSEALKQAKTTYHNGGEKMVATWAPKAEVLEGIQFPQFPCPGSLWGRIWVSHGPMDYTSQKAREHHWHNHPLQAEMLETSLWCWPQLLYHLWGQNSHCRLQGGDVDTLRGSVTESGKFLVNVTFWILNTFDYYSIVGRVNSKSWD